MRSDSRASNEARESRAIAQVASPWSWPRCQHNFISDEKAGAKDQTGILFPLHLRRRDQLSFTLQKSKPGIQTDYSRERINHCSTFIRVNQKRRPAGRAHADLPQLSALHILSAGLAQISLAGNNRVREHEDLLGVSLFSGNSEDRIRSLRDNGEGSSRNMLHRFPFQNQHTCTTGSVPGRLWLRPLLADRLNFVPP